MTDQELKAIAERAEKATPKSGLPMPVRHVVLTGMWSRGANPFCMYCGVTAAVNYGDSASHTVDCPGVDAVGVEEFAVFARAAIATITAELTPLRAREAYRVHVEGCRTCEVTRHPQRRDHLCPEGVRLVSAIK